MSPFISLFTSIANTLLLIFGINPQNNDSVTEDEVKDLIEKGKLHYNTLFNYIKNNDAGLILVTHENELAMRCDKVYKLEELKLSKIWQISFLVGVFIKLLVTHKYMNVSLITKCSIYLFIFYSILLKDVVFIGCFVGYLVSHFVSYFIA